MDLGVVGRKKWEVEVVNTTPSNIKMLACHTMRRGRLGVEG